MTETITAQELFSDVVTKVVAQGCQAIKDGRCAYRTDDGLKCAAGHAIRDGELDFNANNRKAITDIIHLLPERLRPHVALLADLQRCHDSFRSWSQNGFVHDFTRAARDVATHYNLTMPVLP